MGEPRVDIVQIVKEGNWQAEEYHRNYDKESAFSFCAKAFIKNEQHECRGAQGQIRIMKRRHPKYPLRCAGRIKNVIHNQFDEDAYEDEGPVSAYFLGRPGPSQQDGLRQ